MFQDSTDSSIDGDLEDLLRRHGVSTNPILPVSSNFKSRGRADQNRDLSDDEYGEEEFDEDEALTSGLMDGSFNLEGLNSIDMLLPACLKLNQIMSAQGYSPLQLTTSDVNLDLKSISVFVVDSWAESLFTGVTEMIDRVGVGQSAAKDASISAWKNDMTNEVLETRISDLQLRLLESEKRERELLEKCRAAEDRATKDIRNIRAGESDQRKKIKNLEMLLGESERKVRQRDVEMAKLTEKLRQAASKERDAATRRAHAMSSRHLSKSSAVLEALEFENASLKADKRSLETSVVTLQDQLRKAENQSVRVNISSAIDSRDSSRSSRLSELGRDGDDDDDDGDDGEGSPPPKQAGIARQMYDKIKEQQRHVDAQAHRITALTNQLQDSEELLTTYRSRIAEAQSSIENLRLELDSRPTVKQFNAKCKELKDTEDKLHDIVMMRQEASELEGWKKHLGTRERIKADRRNHELGLWVIESLPKSVMKECLEAACRELEVHDISEVQSSIAKLKSVVHQVPRMQQFISEVCTYVFTRAGGEAVGLPARPSMEHVVPVLKQWWDHNKSHDELSKFVKAVHQELARREALLSDGGDIPPTMQGQAPAWYVEGAASWSGKDKGLESCIGIVRDMVDFQVEVLRHKNSFRAAEDFVRENPEAMVSRLVSHTQYLFDIKELEGYLPRLNQVYLFANEMRNFLSAARGLMGLDPKDRDAAVIAQMQRCLQKIYGGRP